jgi:hypothetical protein
MGAYGALIALLLGGFAFLYPAHMSWAYIAAFTGFELWLLRRNASVSREPVRVEEPPYHFDADEARLVGRYQFYFAYPGIAAQSSNVLAALGITALILTPWLTYKGMFVQAALIGLNLFAVARLTKLLAPVMALRLNASRGDREALRMLEVHDPAWAKIRAGNEAGR